MEMKFERCFEDWRVHVSVKGGRLIATFTFSSKDKVLDMAERGAAFGTLADRQAVEYGLSGKGGMTELRLTQEQYNKLLARPRSPRPRR